MSFHRRPLLLSFLLLIAAVAPAIAQETIRIAVTAGPHAQIAEVAKKVAERDGLKLQIVEFNDYIQPNAALDAGDVQANSYQHLPFLQSQIQARGYRISAVGNTVTFPMGFYSKKYKSLAELPQGAKVGIQNDPSNSGRALALLQKYGVIKLKPTAGISATVQDVVENPKKLQIVQIEAAQLPRSLDDLDASAINTNYAVQARLVPTRDAIAIEDPKNPYANLLAVRTEDKDKPWVAKLVKAFQSPEVKQLVESSFAGSMVPAF
ncbi:MULTISPECIES: MetQ/NlpA family ABC transporter substrate-binding protein [unclassified Rhizobacter]|uniref:MetQ/NlpA family ABC transporter substrate-binding protein n=1 Tax=unclassified Rhizobacter TaxID=2640088 RepID=UPI0006F81921|nr:MULTISPECIES: MetQ/NlpA family ABC transporter substrate-binding protein [unclassified Rhizobacter]KQU78565.1 metal ABC transporter substrate-binding protein [Rhizobacter sp. Root29]KQW16095.1 metal ABC transporter substrate-binding protein [Rhizobacter sp. Root1238]KRB25434.1 metal ABC transporter substrate-binding protein [Rhizobacter sp. Root16D2]